MDRISPVQNGGRWKVFARRASMNAACFWLSDACTTMPQSATLCQPSWYYFDDFWRLGFNKLIIRKEWTWVRCLPYCFSSMSHLFGRACVVVVINLDIFKKFRKSAAYSMLAFRLVCFLRARISAYSILVFKWYVSFVPGLSQDGSTCGVCHLDCCHYWPGNSQSCTAVKFDSHSVYYFNRLSMII